MYVNVDTHSTVCDLKIDLAVAVDTSYSMDNKEFKQVQNFLRELSTKLLIDSGLAPVHPLLALSTSNDTLYCVTIHCLPRGAHYTLVLVPRVYKQITLN